MGDVVHLKQRFVRREKVTDLTVLNDMAKWLYEHDFPFSWSTDEPPPSAVLVRLANMYQAEVGGSLPEVISVLYDEGGWTHDTG